MNLTRHLAALFLDALWGSRCLVCGQRVYPKDRAEHDETQHPGEVATWSR